MEELAFPLLVLGSLGFGGIMTLVARWRSREFDRKFHIDGK